jgi:hypothetical protein
MTERERDPIEIAHPSRRALLKGFVAAAFITPVVASFSLDGIASADASTTDNQYMPNQDCEVLVTAVTFLQPINGDGSSVFKAGRVIPVKVELEGAANGSPYTTVTLEVVRLDATSGPVNEPVVSAGAANEGDAFRYDALADQYVYNLSTKGLPSGTYELVVSVRNGLSVCPSVGVIRIGLR